LAAKLTGWRIDVKAIGKDEIEETAEAEEDVEKESEEESEKE